jgi:hypothetical protein
LLAVACAPKTITTAAAVQPGISAEAETFSIAATDDEAAKSLAPLVESRLREMGYRPSDKPSLIVAIATSDRQRGVGAIVPGCGPSGWVAQPGRKWLIGGGYLMTLSVQISNAATGRVLYRSSASTRASTDDFGAQAPRLVSAALGANPREAAAGPAGC